MNTPHISTTNSSRQKRPIKKNKYSDNYLMEKLFPCLVFWAWGYNSTYLNYTWSDLKGRRSKLLRGIDIRIKIIKLGYLFGVGYSIVVSSVAPERFPSV